MSMYTPEGKRFRDFRTPGMHPGTDLRLFSAPVNEIGSSTISATPFDQRIFDKACELAETKPTKRQAKKWRDGCGKTLQFRWLAIAALEEEAKAAAEVAQSA